MWANFIVALAATCMAAVSVARASPSTLMASRPKQADNRDSNGPSPYVLKLIGDLPTGEISIGSPAQKFNLLLDTISSITWVCSASSQAVDCKKHAKYASSDSTTYVPNGSWVYMIRDEGKFEGFESEDNIQLAGLRAKNQTLIEVNKCNAPLFTNANYDGILGLGLFPDGLVSSLGSTAGVAEFSLWFSQNAGQKQGELVFGGIDTNRFTGKLAIARLVSKATSWKFGLDSVVVEGSSSIVCKDGCIARIDTTKKKITGPKDDVARLHEDLGAKLQDDGQYTFASCEPSSIPSLVFQVTGQPMELPAELFVDQKYIDGKWTCYSMLEGTASTEWHLGMPFVRHHYIVFNLNGYLGIATSK